ncbi:hypothetical protein ABZ078_33145 [Streptomyces sp. NPDC006385]|uniref:hypothetical protein n=1 Tax=Streptomyces sp. NPDC006385 TaxID=3156761 RepID=UPI0033BE490F
MPSDFVTAAVGIGGVVVGALGTLLGARMQARGAHAQADATASSAWAQARNTGQNWMASASAHAYANLITDALALEGMIMFMEADFNRSGHPWWRRTWKPLGYDERWDKYADLAANFVHIRYAASVIEMYGGDPVRERPAELVGEADEMRLLARAWILDPSADPPARDEHVQRLREARSRFAAAARQDLHSATRPTS